MSPTDGANVRIELRRDGFNVIGSSAYGDGWSIDRSYAQRMLSSLGLSVRASLGFTRLTRHAVRHGTPARYVFKAQRPGRSDNYVGATRADEGHQAACTP